ncbi:MAG: cyclic nucleotide-binding domain-containing protein [Gaiellaceae bacterium]
MAGAPVETLARVPLFADLDPKELESIAAQMKDRTFKPGDAVTEEGGGATFGAFFVIEEGDALVTVGGEERRQLHAGDHFGEVALLAESERTATVIALTELRCWALSAWNFRPIVDENPELGRKLQQAMARLIS